MKEIVTTEEVDIKNMIHEINGVQVMLDSDLTLIYRVETKRINEEEYNCLKSKFSTSNKKAGSRKGHTVFTEK